MENRNKIMKARITEYEDVLVKAKAEHYGYKNLSKYLIDAAIYEKVTYVDLKNQDKICEAYDLNTKEIKKFIKEIRKITKFATQLDESTITSINNLMFTIIKNQKNMLRLIDEKMDLEVWQEINHNKEIQEE